jgi:multidrug resistance efflux pump
MASRFSRTMRSLDDRGPRPLRLAGTLVVLGIWGAWMGWAKVDVYATTAQARLEVRQLPSRVSSPDAGRITALNVSLGRQVTEGDVLVQLDTTVEQKRLQEELARAANMEPKLDALRRQMIAANEVRASHWRLNGVSARRAKVQLDEADAARGQQEELGVIAKNLSDAQLLSRTDKVKADGDVAASRLKVQGAKVEISRLGATQQYEDKQEAARIAELGRQLSDLEAERSASLAAAETARAQIDRRTVRAAASGRLGSITAMQIGDVLKAGDVIATVVPASDIHVVAEFQPSGAVGRVLPGQHARVRLNGFSWTEYGMLDALVVDVANEPAGGTVRVELVIAADQASAAPIQHGIPAAVDVRVEQASPFALLLRDVGSVVAPPPPPPAERGKPVVAVR